MEEEVKYSKVLKMAGNDYKVLQGGFFNDTLRTWQSRTSTIDAKCLMYPVFVSRHRDTITEIATLPGQYRVGLDRLIDFLTPIVRDGLKSVLLFACDPEKGEREENTATDPVKNPVLPAVGMLKGAFPGLTVACDVCLCAFKSHGHCGVVDPERRNMLKNRQSVEQIVETAYAYAAAGCDIVAPSDMNDGRIQQISERLKQHGVRNRVSIMSYSAKFASCLYGPFRDAAGSGPQGGTNRKCYQLPPGASGLAHRAVARDVAEEADILMVKPAMFYMDIIKDTKTKFPDHPLAVYQVSGEYSMLYHASMNGTFDLKTVVLESLTSLHRAGADILITYYAPNVLKWLQEPSDAEFFGGL